MSAKFGGEENPGEPGLPGDWGVAKSFQGAERKSVRIAATRARERKKKERVPWNALFGAEWLVLCLVRPCTRPRTDALSRFASLLAPANLVHSVAERPVPR